MDTRFLHHLPADAIEELADDYEKQARMLRLRARNVRDKENRAATYQRQLNARDATLKLVMDMIEHERKSFDVAVQAAARFSGIPALTIEHDIGQLMKKRDRRARLAKDAAVMGLLRSGLTNQDISARLHIHPNTVSNIKAKVLNP